MQPARTASSKTPNRMSDTSKLSKNPETRRWANLLELMIKEQEKNLAADNTAIHALQQQIKDNCQDPDQQNRIKSAANRASNRFKAKPEHNSKPKLSLLQNKLAELQPMFDSFTEVPDKRV